MTQEESVTTTTVPAASPHRAGEPTDQAAIDVGVTLGELAGRPVVVAAFATAGITSQLQLPPRAAAQVAVAMLAAAQSAGTDVTELLHELLAAQSPAGLIAPTLTETATLATGRP